MKIETMGVLEAIGTEQEFGRFKKKAVRIKTQQDPQEYLCCDVWQKDYAMLDAVKVGDYVTAEIDVTAREAKDGRWWNSLRLTRLDPIPGAVDPVPDAGPEQGVDEAGQETLPF